MKLLSTMITTEKETTKEITVCVDDQTATALEQCTEEFRHMYILEEYEDQKLSHTETRRIVSYEQITESGFDITDPEESPMEMLVSREVNQRLHRPSLRRNAPRVLQTHENRALPGTP